MLEIGEIVDGTVKSVMKFGAFVELKKGTEGLLHISEIDHKRTEKVEDELKVGDSVVVKVIDVDDQGKISLSRKALLPKPEKDEN